MYFVGIDISKFKHDCMLPPMGIKNSFEDTLVVGPNESGEGMCEFLPCQMAGLRL